MSSGTIFDLGRSNLNPFLYSEIGVDEGGAELSVVSLLARSGRDPWDEAAALARMPASAAVEALAFLISTVPGSVWPLPAATVIARRLIGALPSRATAPVRAARPSTAGLVDRFGWPVALGLLGLALLAQLIKSSLD